MNPQVQKAPPAQEMNFNHCGNLPVLSVPRCIAAHMTAAWNAWDRHSTPPTRSPACTPETVVIPVHQPKPQTSPTWSGLMRMSSRGGLRARMHCSSRISHGFIAVAVYFLCTMQRHSHTHSSQSHTYSHHHSFMSDSAAAWAGKGAACRAPQQQIARDNIDQCVRHHSSKASPKGCTCPCSHMHASTKISAHVSRLS
jgi:hypothetical protein